MSFLPKISNGAVFGVKDTEMPVGVELSWTVKKEFGLGKEQYSGTNGSHGPLAAKQEDIGRNSNNVITVNVAATIITLQPNWGAWLP